MTKGETIVEISRVLNRYEGPDYALRFVTDLFANHVSTPWSVGSSRKQAFRDILIKLRNKYDA
jgi:hypothetical protein